MAEVIELNNGRVESWDNINWEIHERHVKRFQERIFRATQEKKWATVKKRHNITI